LERFYNQTLLWGDCSDFATTPADTKTYADAGLQCTRLTVPLDYTKPNGREIKIGLLRRLASDQGHRIGSLVINPGGPGESGVRYAASLALEIKDNAVTQRFDLVGFDPRGVGFSEPRVVCLTPAERDAERQMNLGVDTSTEGVTKTKSQEDDDNKKCLSHTGEDELTHIGTQDVIRDLDIMRKALRDEKLTYLGYGDGSRLGTGYAEDFPDKVNAMILDSPVNPAYDWSARQTAMRRAQEQGFNAFAGWCAEQKKTDCALGPDKSDAMRRFQELIRPLIDKPAKVDDGRNLSYSDAISGTIALLWSPKAWPELNRGLENLGTGNGSTLMKNADIFYGRLKDGSYSNKMDARRSILCADYPSKADSNDAELREFAPFFFETGTKLSPARDNCAFWPVKLPGKPDTPRTSGLPPVLVIAPTKSSVVDDESGRKLADKINARLLISETNFALSFLAPPAEPSNRCVDQAGISYLTEGQLPAKGIPCPANP
jgi:pimeloyl-ACP methyl ester carboxylesterase